MSPPFNKPPLGAAITPTNRQRHSESASKLSFHCPSAWVRKYWPLGPLTTPTSARLPPTKVKKVLVLPRLLVNTGHLHVGHKCRPLGAGTLAHKAPKGAIS